MKAEDKFKGAGWSIEHHKGNIVGVFQGKSYNLVSKSYVQPNYSYEQELEAAYQAALDKGLVEKVKS